jgi:pullulanase
MNKNDGQTRRKSEFETYLPYGGDDLGATTDKKKTIFKLWSPPAENAVLRLYHNNESAAFATERMEKDGRGVFFYEAEENLHGVYYDYELLIDGKKIVTADPYARSCGVNGQKSMVVDLEKTDPEGWKEDCAPEKQEETVIYEVHVKEFTWDKHSGVPREYRGKYKGFAMEGTTLDGDGIHPTGVDYLKTLGITHIQLLPVFDYGSVDEKGSEKQFNWGYDPVNYNVPEGSYATDPEDGTVRIRELKEMIQNLHRQGFRVIMDVVYNHTYRTDSWLNRTVPGYYYRQNEDGSYSNGSDCGNDMASERPMCGKYILDSVLYWCQEYHMDGFRFDLMGLLDVELMNRIRKTLDQIYGPGEKLVFGEPWAAAESPMEPGNLPALKVNAGAFDENLGFFCDNTRDLIKGHVFYDREPGFVNGGENLEQDLLEAVKGWCGEKGPDTKAPSQIINYISAHDNLTLWDKLIATLRPDGDYHIFYPEILRANRLAAAVYFTCQGHLFFLAGEEHGRTKEGDGNSFQSSVEINRLDWRRTWENQTLADYYRGLIALRKRLPGLCDKTKEAAQRIQNSRVIRKGAVSFEVDNRRQGKTEEWSRLLVIYNSGRQMLRMELPEGKWQVLADGKDSFLFEKEKNFWKGTVRIPKVSALILGLGKEEEEG